MLLQVSGTCTYLHILQVFAGAYRYLRALVYPCMHSFACTNMHLQVPECIFMYLHRFACACMNIHAFAWTCMHFHAFAGNCQLLLCVSKLPYLHVLACTCMYLHTIRSPSDLEYKCHHRVNWTGLSRTPASGVRHYGINPRMSQTTDLHNRQLPPPVLVFWINRMWQELLGSQWG